MTINQSFIPTNLVFPLPFRPSGSYKTSPRKFGSNRSAGHRKHAGCDLYGPVGTPILAMASGTVIRTVYGFYCSTFAIEIKHGSFVARYGEILRNPAKDLKEGDQVQPGQVIGAIGQLDCYHKSMLHLELYQGTEQGPLTVRGNSPYRRRSDLIDPTSFLDAARVAIGSSASGGVIHG